MNHEYMFEEDRIQCSTEMSAERWKELMSGSVAGDYEDIKNFCHLKCPQLYSTLALDYPNPYAGQCGETPTHYILAHSLKQYFIAK